MRTAGSPSFDGADLEVAEELGRRAGLAVANAKQYSREQHVAETLQRAFLNEELPNDEMLHFSAMYQAAQDESSLGGDWYDAFSVQDRVVITIGDVTGKGVEAARLMVQLRQWVRMTARVSADPAEVLSLLNNAILSEGRNELATAFVGIIERNAGLMRYSSAGHPPPICKPRHGGTPYALRIEAGLPLGAAPDGAYVNHTLRLDDAALLTLYTDGLTEIDRDPVAGEAALIELLRSDDVLYAANPARFVSRLSACRSTRDDTAVLVVRFDGSRARWRLTSATRPQHTRSSATSLLPLRTMMPANQLSMPAQSSSASSSATYSATRRDG